jgi:hypothetical protein
MDTNAIRIYSLDRAVGIILQEQQATPPANLGNYLYYSFGMCVKTDPNPQEVVLKTIKSDNATCTYTISSTALGIKTTLSYDTPNSTICFIN